jgi:hypothetical protein
MLSSFPLTENFALAWEHDPALDRAREAFAHEYKVAVETLSWEALTIPGQRPTMFVFKAIDGDTMLRLLESGIGPVRKTALAFRLALVRVDGLDGCPEVKRARDSSWPGLPEMLSADATAYFSRLSMAHGQQVNALVLALGDIVIARSMGVDPK